MNQYCKLSTVLRVLINISAFCVSAFAWDGVNIISPNGGEQFSVEQTITIKWRIDTTKVKSNIVFYYSPDNGVSRFEILTDKNIVFENSEIYTGEEGSIEWTIPDSIITPYTSTSTVSDSCRLVALAPYEITDYMDATDDMFSIGATSPSGSGKGCGAGSSAVLIPFVVAPAISIFGRKRNCKL